MTLMIKRSTTTSSEIWDPTGNDAIPLTRTELSYEKTINFDFRPDPTQTGLYSHSISIEACNFGFMEKGIEIFV